VTIFPHPATGGSVTGSVGATQQFRARLAYQGGVTQGVNTDVTWSSSNPGTVSVKQRRRRPRGAGAPCAAGDVTISIVFPATASSPQLTDSVQLIVR